MKQITIVGVFVLILISDVTCRAIDDDGDMDNSIPQVGSKAGLRDFLKVATAPPAKYLQSTNLPTEVQCEYVGSPPPTVQWIRGYPEQSSIDQIETNEIRESSSTAMASVRALLILNHIVPNESTFTCVAQSGEKVASTSTTMYNKISTFNEVLSMGKHKGPKAARIVYHYSYFFDLAGKTLILPCRAIGRPYPRVSWLDIKGNMIGTDSRYKVLSNGDLLIAELNWADMGQYTCIAHNEYGKDSATTFVYPLKEIED